MPNIISCLVYLYVYSDAYVISWWPQANLLSASRPRKGNCAKIREESLDPNIYLRQELSWIRSTGVPERWYLLVVVRRRTKRCDGTMSGGPAEAPPVSIGLLRRLEPTLSTQRSCGFLCNSDNLSLHFQIRLESRLRTL